MKRMPPSQLNFGSEDFFLMTEVTQDGERIIREQQQREADQIESEKFQTRLTLETSHTV